jgi:hypothetical protein
VAGDRCAVTVARVKTNTIDHNNPTPLETGIYDFNLNSNFGRRTSILSLIRPCGPPATTRAPEF